MSFVEYLRETQEICYGVYRCITCNKEYFVNDGTWRRCTPTTCHDCTERADAAQEKDK